MDHVELRSFEHRLHKWRQTLEEQRDSSEDFALDDEEPIDEPAARRLDQLWLRVVESQTREIERALDKIRAGGFGACEQCGRAISPKRLEVIPWARKCFPCHSAAPHPHSTFTRYLRVWDPRWYSAS